MNTKISLMIEDVLLEMSKQELDINPYLIRTLLLARDMAEEEHIDEADLD